MTDLGLLAISSILRQKPIIQKARQPLIFNRLSDFAVPKKGLEPSRLAAHAPETCASTNSATWAF